jgi:alanyl-tRNA synthetase
MAAFETLLLEQKVRSREATEVNTGDWTVVNPSPDLPRFVGYDTLAMQTRIRQYRTVRKQNKAEYHLVLEETPFYAESGGQTGDRGLLRTDGETIRVLDTKKENELIVHTVDRLPQEADGEWHAEVDAVIRHRTSQNHSATHLVHAALRQVLGTHVEQRGSLVSESVLRFDFSHFARVGEEELAQVEAIVNERIAADIPLTEYREIPIADARAMGAMALFGEKYGEQVRVIVFDPAFSVELCGGTHVPRTGQIRLFKFVSEGSVAAGVRRIEAYTGEQAAAYLNSQLALVQRLSEKLKQPASLEKALDDLLERNRQLEKELAQLNSEKLAALRETLAGAFEARGGLQLLRRRVEVGSADDLKQLSFDLKRSAEGRALIVLGAVIGGKPQLSVILSDSLAAENRYHAGNMVRELAKPIQGGGGGQPFYATAGGKDPAGLQAALDKVEELL